MGKIKKKNWFLSWGIWILVVILGSIFVTLIVHWIYPVEPKDMGKIIRTNISAGELLMFVGSFLAFVGTVFLGTVALKQNINSNDVSRRMLTIQEGARRPWPYIEKNGFRILVPDNYRGYSDEALSIFNGVNLNTSVEFNMGGGFSTSVARFILPIRNAGNCPIVRIKFESFNKFFRGVRTIHEQNIHNICIPSGEMETISIDFQKTHSGAEPVVADFEQDRAVFVAGLITTYIKFNIICENIHGETFEQKVQIYPRFNEDDVFEETGATISSDFNGIIELNNNTIINYPLSEEDNQ